MATSDVSFTGILGFRMGVEKQPYEAYEISVFLCQPLEHIVVTSFNMRPDRERPEEGPWELAADAQLYLLPLLPASVFVLVSSHLPALLPPLSQASNMKPIGRYAAALFPWRE